MLATEVMMSVLSESRGSRGDVDALYGAIVDRKFHAIMLGKETSAHASPGDVVREVAGYLSFNEAQAKAPKKQEAPKLGLSAREALFLRGRGTITRAPSTTETTTTTPPTTTQGT
jgi:pyruvate kinase